jgi:NAD(P) transhydrogenase subunit beta
MTPLISPNLAALLYLASGVLFIMALRGLSSPVTSRTGNRNGMIGMAIAVATTLALRGVSDPVTWGMIIVGIAIGGIIGAIIARRIAMTAMPQLVAAFHSLVGLAAVLVAGAALYSPEAYGIGEAGAIHTQSLIEMTLGVAIGAITFAGSLIAFAKLNGNMSGASILLPGRHWLNLAILGVIVWLGTIFVASSGGAIWAFWALAGLSFVIGITLIIPIGGHAGRHLDAELLFRLGGGGHRLHAREHRADHHRRLGRLLGRDPQLHHVQGHEPLLHLRHRRRLRR